MNKIQYIKWKNAWMQKLDRESRKKTNCVRFSKPNKDGKGGETFEHIIAKVEIVNKKLIDFDYVNNEYGRAVRRIKEIDDPRFEFTDFLTEVYSKDRKFRADVLLFTENTPTIIEIANKSESKESIEKKKAYWCGLGFEFIEVRI